MHMPVIVLNDLILLTFSVEMYFFIVEGDKPSKLI